MWINKNIFVFINYKVIKILSVPLIPYVETEIAKK